MQVSTFGIMPPEIVPSATSLSSSAAPDGTFLTVTAPAATLELWERYLVYGIAFGIAERVLQGAQLHMPEALAQASNLYWIGPHGDLASGPTSLGIGDLASGFGSALAPPSSGSGGFGGGFSGDRRSPGNP